VGPLEESHAGVLILTVVIAVVAVATLVGGAARSRRDEDRPSRLNPYTALGTVSLVFCVVALVGLLLRR
jgi:uncharacterized membrane protein YidH (DUF202 family)